MIFNSKSKKSAFTVLELIVVIALFSVLVTLVVNTSLLVRMKGRDTGRVATIKELRTALEQYKLEYGQYPQCLWPAGTCTEGVALSSAPFMSKMPVDPVGNVYMYTGYAAVNGGTPCIGYHIGIALEERNSLNLQNDSDIPSQLLVCGNSVAIDFSGLSYPAKAAEMKSCGTSNGAAVPSANPNVAETCYDFGNP